MRAEKAQRILLTLAVASFTAAAVFLLGELLAWRGDVTLIAAMSVAVLAGVATLLLTPDSGEARRDHAPSPDAGPPLASVAETLDSVDRTLDSIDDKLDDLDKLDKLEKLDTVDGKLDAVQAELDQQTGVLGRQVSLLEQIRDRL